MCRSSVRVPVVWHHRLVAATVRVYLEAGRTRTFACAVDWPGWCRRGKGAEEALDALDGYRGRYRAATGERVPAGPFEIVGTLPGVAGTEFGVPAQFTGEWDRSPVSAADLARSVRILRVSWAALDRLGIDAPEELAKGPRGGGRDRDKILDHVRDAERAYGPSMGIKLPAALTWPEQRDRIVAHLQAYGEAKWPLRYAGRRLAWHILDHVWEIEDRSTTAAL